MSVPVPIDFEYLAPSDVTGSAATSFKEMVLAADEVDPLTLPQLYQNALVLGFARSAGKLVGVGAVKRPWPRHRDGLFSKAHSEMSPASFTYELGWFHTLKAFEGQRIASRLVEGLMPWTRSASTYATSRVNNLAMHAALTRRGGFVAEGSEYPSQQGDIALRLFIRR